jgi:hypothetical protein
MLKKLTLLVSVAALPLAACKHTPGKDELEGAAKGGGLGAVAGAGVAAVTGGSVLTGAVVGAAVGGIAGAIWADKNGDGKADGYVRQGKYYPSEPPQ